LFFEKIGIGKKIEKYFPSKQEITADTNALLQKCLRGLNEEKEIKYWKLIQKMVDSFKNEYFSPIKRNKKEQLFYAIAGQFAALNVHAT